MARDWATGAKNPWKELFDVDRKKIKGGAWDYLRENKDYPYYLIKSRFADPEAESVRGLQPGEGRIVKSKVGKSRPIVMPMARSRSIPRCVRTWGASSVGTRQKEPGIVPVTDRVSTRRAK